MNKIIILPILLIISFTSRSQHFIKSRVPCNDALMQQTPGRWIRDKSNVYALNLNTTQIQEILKRLNNVQELALKTYPTPIGVDATWDPQIGDELFGSQLKFSKTTEGESKYTFVNGIPVGYSAYKCGFFQYSCGRDPFEIRTGWPGETTTHLLVYINNLNNFFVRDQTEPALRESMCVDGRPIKMMPPVKGSWKNYTLYTPEKGSVANIVLLHRDGLLPYIPVTRKQYLDRCIEYVSKSFEQQIKSLEAITDKQQREELIKNYRKQKEDQLKHYEDELSSSSVAKLLNSPAIISLFLFNGNGPVFITEEDGGYLLVTENPVYIRKDLPKYASQFMVMVWSCGDWKPQQDVCRAVNEYFPIDKLQAMIDK